MYDVAVPILSQMVKTYKQRKQQGKFSADTLTPGNDLLVKSMTMLKNIMADSTDPAWPARPVHPLGYLAVVKDFETSLNSHQGDKMWKKNDFLLRTPNCSGGCYGAFQISINQHKKDWGDRNDNDLHPVGIEKFCTENGLNIYHPENGYRGALDFCAKFYWWIKADGGYKCKQLHPIYEKCFNNSFNYCTDEKKSWDHTTFAYAWRCPYVQENQWSSYGIENSWQLMYTGFDTSKYNNINGSFEIQGYEDCATQRFIRTINEQGKCVNYERAYGQNESAPEAQLIQMAVAQFACEIGLFPSWLKDQDCKVFDHDINNPSAPAEQKRANGQPDICPMGTLSVDNGMIVLTKSNDSTTQASSSSSTATDTATTRSTIINTDTNESDLSDNIDHADKNNIIDQ